MSCERYRMNYTEMVKKINYNNKKNKKVYYLLPKGKTKDSHDRSLSNELYFDAPHEQFSLQAKWLYTNRKPRVMKIPIPVYSPI